jgi:BA14K-like protein
MNNIFGALALSAMLGLGFASVQTQPASAAGPTALQSSVSEGVVQLAQFQSNRRDRVRQNWRRDRDGRRCSSRSDRCRHYRNGYYYETPWWTLPLIIGGGIVAQGLNDDRYDDYGGSHVQWCRDRYRSYNVRTNTWVAYSGAVRQCNSPYN